VARYAGTPECMSKCEEAIRVQQNNDAAVMYGLTAAKIMERVILVITKFIAPIYTFIYK
jgi:hypothetical protein